MSSLCQVLLFAFFSRIAFIQWNLLKLYLYIGTPLFKLTKSGFKRGGGPWSGISLHRDMKRHVSVVLKKGGGVHGQGYIYMGI